MFLAIGVATGAATCSKNAPPPPPRAPTVARKVPATRAPPVPAGTAAAGTAAPGAAPQSPAERVREILDKVVAERAAGTGAAGAAGADFKGIPGLGDLLREIVQNRKSDLRWAAAEQLGALREPASVPVLLRILEESPPAAVKPDARSDDPLRLREAAVAALAEHDGPDAATRLDSLLSIDASSVRDTYGQVPQAAIYRLLARVGRPGDLATITTANTKRRPRGLGWTNLCVADDEDASAPKSRESVARGIARPPATRIGHAQACVTVAEAGEIRVGVDGFGVWLRRKSADGKRWEGPALALRLPAGAPPRVDSATLAGRMIALRGSRLGAAGPGGRPPAPKPWAAEVDPAKAFADGDRDGIPDATEQVLRTDAKVADTDGDTVSDGEDPSPLCKTGDPTFAAVQAEAARHALYEMEPRPAVVIVGSPVDRWGEMRDAASVVIHRALAAPGSKPPPAATADIDAPAVAIDEVKVTGETATALVRLASAPGAGGARRRCSLKLVAGAWRVVRTEPVP